jgi:hypothetical protein
MKAAKLEQTVLIRIPMTGMVPIGGSMRNVRSSRKRLKALRVLAAATFMAAVSIFTGSMAKGEMPGWLAELPPAAKVQALFPTSTPETYAKQSAVFAVLVDVIEVRSGVDPKLHGPAAKARLTPEAGKRWTEYAPHGYSQILTSASGSWQMFVNPGFREDVLSRFLPKTSIEAYEDARNRVPGVPGASNVKANWKPVEAPVAASHAPLSNPSVPSWRIWGERLFGGEKGQYWFNVLVVAAMVGVAILLLERWLSRIPRSSLIWPHKERLFSKVTAFYWMAAIFFDLSTIFVILTNRHNKGTIIYGNSVPIAVAVFGISIFAGAFLDRHRKAFLSATRKRNAAFRAKAGATEYQSYVLGTAIALDKVGMKISLMDDESSKTYDFSDVRGWTSRWESPGRAFGPAAEVRAMNQQMALDAQDASGLFFNVKDIDHPVWHIRMSNKPTLDRWHEILTQALER